MSQEVTINGKKFLPSATLAREFGYTLDYVSRLAREEKVEATRVGRVWFVEPSSLSFFVESAKEKKESARKQLKVERREEHRAYTTLHQEVAKPTPSGFSVESPNERKQIVLALAGSALVMFAGVMAAAAVNPKIVINLLDNPGKAIVETENPAGDSLSAGAVFSRKTNLVTTEDVEDSEGTRETQGLVVFDEPKEISEIERIKQQFSDEVEIKMEGEGHGVITPVFKGRESDDYQFLMVPVKDPS